MSDVIESPTQLRMLADEKDLAGKTWRGVVAPRIGLANADLDSVTLERVGLVEGNLHNVRIEHAQLRSVDLTRANLSNSLLHRMRTTDNTSFTEADLTGAELRRCEFGGRTVMHRANFTRVKEQSSTFRAVELYGANFTNAVLLRTQFLDYGNGTASLIKVRFVEAVLIEVDLREVNLQHADFTRALLIRCDLRAANLSQANLTGAHMIGCQTQGTDLSGAIV